MILALPSEKEVFYVGKMLFMHCYWSMGVAFLAAFKCTVIIFNAVFGSVVCLYSTKVDPIFSLFFIRESI